MGIKQSRAVNPIEDEDSLPDVASRSFRRRGEVETTRTRTIHAATPLPSSWLLHRSLTRSLFLARYERPENRVNMTATESTIVPTPEAMFSAVGER
jgi:hypothetical protein